MSDVEKDKALAVQIAQRVAEKGGKTYYVGGYVRDQVLGRDNKDIDIEIHDIEPKKLRDILSDIGPMNEIGASFGILQIKGYDVDIAQPRRERKVGERHVDFDVEVDPFMGTEAAAKRRDFSMNAMMRDVLTGEVVDHFGGMDAIQSKKIALVDDNTFREDPLRVLRAAQFAARFGFTVDDHTKDVMRDIDISDLTHERINGEMQKAMLKAEKPSIFFETLRETGHLEPWFPELQALVGSEQNKTYHPEGDVWTHTMAVVDRAAKYRDKVSDPYAFMLSALCHDMGKPATQAFNEAKGVYQNIGHEEAGVAPAKAFLDRVVNNTSTRDYVLNMVKTHGKPYTAFAGKARVSRTNYMFDEITHGNDMIYLTLADKQNMPDDKLAEYEKWITDRLSIYNEAMSRPQVGGKDLIDMGLRPSKEFSDLISEAHKLHLGGQSKDSVMTTFRHRFGIPDITTDEAQTTDLDL